MTIHYTNYNPCDRAGWLKLRDEFRKKGVGGSELARVAGVPGAFGSAYAEWAERTGRLASFRTVQEGLDPQKLHAWFFVRHWVSDAYNRICELEHDKSNLSLLLQLKMNEDTQELTNLDGSLRALEYTIKLMGEKLDKIKNTNNTGA